MRTGLFKSSNQEPAPTLIVLVKQSGKKELTHTAGSCLHQEAVENCCLYVVCFLSHCYAPSHHLCPLICPVKPFLSTSRVLFELLALGHSPMQLCWVHIHEIHIALGKGEGLGKLQEILSYMFSCLSFLITFSQYKLQSVWDHFPTICCSFSFTL